MKWFIHKTTENLLKQQWVNFQSTKHLHGLIQTLLLNSNYSKLMPKLTENLFSLGKQLSQLLIQLTIQFLILDHLTRWFTPKTIENLLRMLWVKFQLIKHLHGHTLTPRLNSNYYKLTPKSTESHYLLITHQLV